MRKSALGIRLIVTSITIDAMKLKLCSRSKQRIGNSGEFVVAHEEYQDIEACRKLTLGEDPRRKH